MNALLRFATVFAAVTQVTSDMRYTAQDSMTWAVMSDQLSDPIRQAEYDTFMAGCRESAGDRADTYCNHDESFRMQMNAEQPRSVRNYTETGFLKIKAPEAVFSLVKEFWDKNKEFQIEEWSHASSYHNTWEAPTTIIRVDNDTLSGGGQHLYAAIANAARDAMEAWTGMPQSSTSVYGIRSYPNQSILAPHVDRLPLVSSAIINVAQDVDEDWLLEVYDHQGVAHNVTMEPGDLVLYESHSVIHGRPFRMNGRFYANIFVHFEPLGLPLNMPGSNEQGTAVHDYNTELPPYVIPGSIWETEYRTTFPNGWSLMKDVFPLVQKGDLETLRYLVKLNAAKVHDNDGTSADWRPVHEAARSGHKAILQYLIEEHNVDVNQLCLVGGGTTPLALSLQTHGAEHEASVYLASVGGVAQPEHLDNAHAAEEEHPEHPEDWEEEEDETYDEDEEHDEYHDEHQEYRDEEGEEL